MMKLRQPMPNPSWLFHAIGKLNTLNHPCQLPKASETPPGLLHTPPQLERW
jgi:hypothetical protein